jgi:uncharacterized protein
MKPVTVTLALHALLTCAAEASGQTDPPAGPSSQEASQQAAQQASRAAGWRLADATSPYVRAHADNPVEWYPWGPEAFARAKELDRPVFLSIGYSACHWCHRMEHDTFEDEECARLLNELFVCIKVDREERPDIDSRAMQSLALITGGGGWPASLFLTPEGLAFAGGTYFPPEDTPQGPGFKSVLKSVSDLWKTQRGAVLDAGRELNDALLRDPLAIAAAAAAPDAAIPDAAVPDAVAPDAAEPERAAVTPPSGDPDLAALVDHGLLELTGSLDAEHGGTFGAPKFPPPLTLSFLLGQHVRTGVDVLPIVRRSLDAMAGGALQDHVGGGFHRYCIDEDWKVPHFEKMLADNALLAQSYAEAYAVTGDAGHADVARRTLGFLQRDMRLPGGLYASSLDADSAAFDERGIAAPGAPIAEGRVYLWSVPELKAALGDADGGRIAVLFGATIEGNFEAGRSILRPMATRAELAAATGAGALAGWPEDAPRGEALLPWLDGCLSRLAATRARRPQPFRDEKVLAAPNGLMLSALARAFGLLDEPALRDDVLFQASVLKAVFLREGPPSLRHQVFEGVPSGEPDLADHAALALGLLDAASALGASDLIADAMLLARQLLDRFEDPAGGFHDTTGSDPFLPGRGRDVWDGAMPSGTSLALQLLLRLAPLDDSGRFATAAEKAIARLAPLARQAPPGFPALFSALEMARGPLLEIVIDGYDEPFEALFAEARRRLLPAALVVPHVSLTNSMFGMAGLPAPGLLEGRTAPKGEARAWVCVNRACLLPASTPAELAGQLETAGRR